MRRLVMTLLSVGLVAGMGSPAAAHRKVGLDGDDTASKLDIVAVTGKEVMRRGRMRFVHRIVTYETWETSLLAGKHVYLRIQIGRNRNIFIDVADDGSLIAQVDAPRPAPARVPVWRPDQHSVAISFPRWMLPNPDSYRWRGLTAFEEEGSVVCPPTESAPDRIELSSCPDASNWLRHRL